MWVCVGGQYGKIEGLKWMKTGMCYLCGFYELVKMVCGMVDG